jgi:hypothetical protein
MRLFWLGAILAIAAPRLALAEGRTLQHDVFARPPLGFQPAAPAPRPGGAAAATAAKPALKVHAVLVAGAASMANVDGVMVRVGDIVHGYRLVEVHERGAIFEKNKTQFAVPLSGIKPEGK